MVNLRWLMIFGLITLLPLSSHAQQSQNTDAAASYLLVGNKGEDTVSFINLITGKEEARKSVSQSAPHEIALSPGSQDYAAVVNYGNAAIDIFDVESRELIHSYDLRENTRPHGIVWLEDGRIIATTEGGQSIVIISAEGPIAERTLSAIAIGQNGTHMLAVSSDGRFAYTANLGSGSISMVDLEKGETLKSVAAGSGTEGIDITNDDSEIWVSARGSHEVYVFDAKTLDRLVTIPVGQFPLRLMISPDGQKAVTSNLIDGTLSVIDVKARQLERTIKVSESSERAQVTILFSPDGEKIYVAETGTNTIAEVDFASGRVLRRLVAGTQGDGLAITGAQP